MDTGYTSICWQFEHDKLHQLPVFLCIITTLTSLRRWSSSLHPDRYEMSIRIMLMRWWNETTAELQPMYSSIKNTWRLLLYGACSMHRTTMYLQGVETACLTICWCILSSNDEISLTPWTWRLHVPTKRRFYFNGMRGFLSHKIEARTSNPTISWLVLLPTWREQTTTPPHPAHRTAFSSTVWGAWRKGSTHTGPSAALRRTCS